MTTTRDPGEVPSQVRSIPTQATSALARRSVLLGGAALVAGAGLLDQAPASAAGTPDAAAASAQAWTHLSPAQRAGQRVIWSYPGLTPPPALLDAIRAGLVGGVIFFGENIDRSNRSQIQTVTRDLARAQTDSGVGFPLLVMTDQEGGVVQRLPGAPGLSEKQVGQSLHPVETARTMGTATALNLLDAGCNCNLAPVLDVFRVAGNFDDRFGRSYSMEPDVCGRCGAASITAQQKLDVVTTAKHFPGLGAATAAENTDVGPVVLDVSKADLREIDELPFRYAVDAKVDMVMTSWATYPALDPALPAGISPTIVQGELRQRLGFSGVTITDAIEAGALDAFGDTGERAVRAAAAGMDVVLCSARDVGQGQAAVDALAAAVASGELDPGEAREALKRVLFLRRGAA